MLKFKMDTDFLVQVIEMYWDGESDKTEVTIILFKAAYKMICYKIVKMLFCTRTPIFCDIVINHCNWTLVVSLRYNKKPSFIDWTPFIQNQRDRTDSTENIRIPIAWYISHLLDCHRLSSVHHQIVPIMANNAQL